MSDRPPSLEKLFQQANKIGKKRYHKLTSLDFEKYLAYERWRFINGDSECGTTPESRKWVGDNAESHCPVCGHDFRDRGGPSIDHKLPRAQYPWLSMDFRNLWVICRDCNREKAEKHWFEYEHYMMLHHPNRYRDIQFARPTRLLKNL